jgi:outer membrane protein OmpA-like peptidoglycan-associated protein
MLDVDSDERALRFGIGSGFVTFNLGDRLKGPRVAAVESPKPVPVPAPAMPAAPKIHSIEFGYNKSRVSIAIGQKLDPIIAEWRDKPAKFNVVGHADTVGTDVYNAGFSQQRA